MQPNDVTTNPTAPVSETVTATVRYDPISYYHWLEFDGKPSEAIRDQLKARGWRWSSYRQQWRSNMRQPIIPDAITVTDGGTCDYASERAARLDARAAQHDARYHDLHDQAHARAQRIPFGQPILVGHHSQRRHERDLERIHNTYGKAFAELQKSNDDTSAAKRSRNFQSYKQTAPAMTRRLERLNKEIRQLHRILDGLDPELTPKYYQHTQQRLDTIRAQVAELERAIEDAGGLLADHTEVHPGDFVNLRGYTVRVTRVNPKTYSGVIVMPENRGLDGWKGKWDRTDFRGIVRRADEPPTPAEVLAEQNQQESAQKEGN